MSRVVSFTIGVLSGIYLDQNYYLPDIDKVGKNLSETLNKRMGEMSEMSEIEKKEDTNNPKNKIENKFFQPKK